MYYRHHVVRIFLVIIGTFSVILGVIGIFVPFLPTVPFLLLAAYCYARSSEWLYNRLIHNSVFGKIITNYKQGKGVPVGVKVYSLVLLWIFAGYSILFALRSLFMKILLFVIGVAVTVHLMMLKTYKNSDVQ